MLHVSACAYFSPEASGAIGNYLVRQLVEHGHQVTATTHSTSKVERLRAAGAVPVWNTWRDGFRAALIETTVPATYIRRDGDIPSLQRR